MAILPTAQKERRHRWARQRRQIFIPISSKNGASFISRSDSLFKRASLPLSTSRNGRDAKHIPLNG